MIGIIITIIITQAMIVVWHIVHEKLHFKKQIENKLGKKIKFRDIK